MKQVIVLRAIPGAGKTTLISRLEKEYGHLATICSADHYHYFGKEQIPDNYKFDIKNQKKAHESCRKSFSSALKSHEQLIVVDNTNINFKDYVWYYREARKHEYNVVFHTIRGCSVEDSFKSNVHMVPKFVIENMLTKFVDTPAEIDGEPTDEVVYDFHELRNFKNNSQPAIVYYPQPRIKPLKELRASDVPRGIDPDDLANDQD